MTVLPLHPPRVSGLVTSAQEQIRAAAEIAAATVRTDELGETIQRLSELESQATSLRLQLSAEADHRQVANSTAESGTDAWLATLTGNTRAQMAGGLWLARMLEETYPATREAFAAGLLRLDQVKVIVNAGQRAPAGVTPEQLHEAEELLVGKATGAANRSGRPIDARRLRQLARRMFETISPELADLHESDQLRAEEDRAERETWFALGDNGDGTWSGRFVIPELHGNLLQHALDRLTSPRRYSRAADGEQIEDHTLPGQGPTEHLRAVRRGAVRAHRTPADRGPHRHHHRGGRHHAARGAGQPDRRGPPRHRVPHLGSRGPSSRLRERPHPAGPRRQVRAARPRSTPPSSQP